MKSGYYKRLEIEAHEDVPLKRREMALPEVGRTPSGLSVQCPRCYSNPDEPCAEMHPNGVSRLGFLNSSHIARIAKEQS